MRISRRSFKWVDGEGDFFWLRMIGGFNVLFAWVSTGIAMDLLFC